ncbi:4-hydroxy-3-methylbut-2-enyl diphosphate reductase [Candidatus Curtissbacteria bacterium RBG_13_35_7]|uniref:4-hydroxy-3-methylbut-2-enyl diphosphate reductase n=1 Tax=Candidatus Curtissbacteria bacterium RBG_13_35_7 TaxID=1797705 RepID=A0A1F5G334_9BACT|nr:MAG: 4-hydroxy-3-methylbut-2-enyl diphosphate reductase [Candidatus Curtissbacteria bacterium RBG_13_35_7]
MIEKIILIKPRGFCAGVDRAIDIVEAALAIYGKPIYVKHAIVHNTHVVSDLKRKGVVFVENIGKVPKNSVLIFSAHGTDPRLIEKAKQKRHKVIDATCPLVTKVHLEANRYANEGYFIIYVGHEGHPEPIGVFGEVSKKSILLIEKASDVRNLKIPQEDKIVCLTQTTLSVDDTRDIICALKKRFKRIMLPPSSDICYSTTNRQAAAKILAKKCDLVLVIGSKTSSNSQRLVKVCREFYANAHLIDDEKDVKRTWLTNVKVLGITSGASVPEYLIDHVIEFIKTQNSKVKIQNIEAIDEKTRFPLPDELANQIKKTGFGLKYLKKHRSTTQI